MSTKSGTNDYHGAATWQHWQQRYNATQTTTNAGYWARIYQAEGAGNAALAQQLRNTERQPTGRSNNWAGSVGGPVRVPWLFPKGKVVESDVEAMDIFPTLLELAGVRVRDDVQGESLRALAWDEVGRSPRASLSLNGNINRGLKSGRYRLVLAGAGGLELYDELEDPRDQKNLADKHPIALRQMRNIVSVLVAHEGKWRKREWGSAASLTEGFYKATAAP